MFAEFFQTGPIPADQMIGSYNISMVLLSYLIGTLASFVALDVTGRLKDITNTQLTSYVWLIGGSFAMGIGIWSMHFIGMLAFKMPMPMRYDPFLTGLSMLVAVFASFIAFSILRSKNHNLFSLIFGGVILGLAIASMHYVGMAAMTPYMHIRYLPGIFILSIIIAIIASEAALYLAIKSSRYGIKNRLLLKISSAMIMGAAICGMHYTGMAAAIFTPLETMQHDANIGTNPEILSVMIAMATIFILAIAMGISFLKEALNSKSVDMARQSGMAEVASSVLHNVGNVLNSVNISAFLMRDHLKEINLEKLEKVNELIEANKEDLATFFTTDPKGSRLPGYLRALSQKWQEESHALQEEMVRLEHNIEHIKTIISLQQSMNGIMNFREMHSVDKIMEEALLLTGINFPMHKIEIIREYGKINPIYVDKLKLIQILINLIHNAKESVVASTLSEKKIVLQTGTEKNSIVMRIVDNGVGIEKINHTKIFSYGFTTKRNGHGFGLHASSLLSQEMKGSLLMDSQGVGKGAMFTLTLPNIHP